MKYAIVVSSVTGNTRMLADKIYETKGKENCLYFGTPSKEALNADVLYIGFWTNIGTCDKDTEEFLKLVKNKKVFLFGTAGWGQSKEYLDQVINSVKEKAKDNEIIGSFMCLGKMRERVKEKYLKMREEGVDEKKVTQLLENYNNALGHPNAIDLENLAEKLK